MTVDLRPAWRATIAAFDPPAAAAAEAFDELAARYAEPWRRYHTLEHVSEVLGWVDRLAGHAADATAVRLAVWAHDVVYDPKADANEAASAAWARRALPALGVPPETVDDVARLVELTAGHDPGSGDRDGAVLADADLAILGAGARRYRRYARDVRDEYSWLPEERWRSGRAAVLAGLAARPVLYRTTTARSLLDARARANLAWELGTLADGGPSTEPGGP